MLLPFRFSLRVDQAKREPDGSEQQCRRFETAGARGENGACCDECSEDDKEGVRSEEIDKGGESGARCEEGSKDGKSRKGWLITSS
jgi:hypothetical protein